MCLVTPHCAFKMVTTHFVYVVNYLFKVIRISFECVPVLQWILILFISWMCIPLFIEHLLCVRHCSKCFIVHITSFDHQSICITIPILLTRSPRPSTFSVTCRRAGFFAYSVQENSLVATGHSEYQLLVRVPFLSLSLIKSLIDLLIENIYMYFAHELGRLS